MKNNPPSLAGKKLGIMVAAAPDTRNFHHAIRIASASIQRGAQVYIYFIDDSVSGLGLAEVQALGKAGGRVFGCAFSLQRRRLPMDQSATMVGLTMLNEIMVQTDRFLAFT